MFARAIPCLIIGLLISPALAVAATRDDLLTGTP
jgi:hypothetical protein